MRCAAPPDACSTSLAAFTSPALENFVFSLHPGGGNENAAPGAVGEEFVVKVMD